jgi:hypothetical protein
MNNRFKPLLIILTAIQINIGCKKEQSELVRIDIESSRGYVLVQGSLVHTPTTFYWPIDSRHEISSLGSWTGDLVKVSIYKELKLDVKHERKGQVVFTYEVQP